MNVLMMVKAHAEDNVLLSAVPVLTPASAAQQALADKFAPGGVLGKRYSPLAIEFSQLFATSLCTDC